MGLVFFDKNIHTIKEILVYTKRKYIHLKEEDAHVEIPSFIFPNQGR